MLTNPRHILLEHDGANGVEAASVTLTEVSPRSAVVPPKGAWCGATSRAAGRRQRPPALRRNTSARERVACVSSGPGVAAQAVTWSPSYSRSLVRSPERFRTVGSHRPSTAARAPEAAIPRRRCGASFSFFRVDRFRRGRPAPPGRLKTMLLIDEPRRSFRRSIPSRRARARNPLLYKNALNERFVEPLLTARRLARETQEDLSTRKKNIRQMPSLYPANAESPCSKTSGECRVIGCCWRLVARPSDHSVKLGNSK